MTTDVHDEPELVDGVLSGDQRALARAITRIENRSAGYRALVSALHPHTGSARVIGITGAPGAGKSTLVDKLAAAYRERGDTVGVVAVDPSSPYTGGAVLGDRIRMASNVGDMAVFFRSMSARGQLGGLSMATADAVKALDAFGKDVVIVETVGAGQNEVDIVRAADTVAVLVQPGSGDDVQTLKAGILEIGDVFVVNKADREGAERTVAELEEMVHRRLNGPSNVDIGHHAPDSADFGDDASRSDEDVTNLSSEGVTIRSDADETQGTGEADASTTWAPPVVRTVATTGDGVDDLLSTFDEHAAYARRSGEGERTERRRFAEEIRTLVRADLGGIAQGEIDRQGGIEALAERVQRRETDPYRVADTIVEPIVECVDDRNGSVDG